MKDDQENDDELKKTGAYFQNSVLADSITNHYAREYGAKIFVFTGAEIDINPILKKEIEKTKNND